MKVVFIASHLCSDSDVLFSILNGNDRIQGLPGGSILDHPLTLQEVVYRTPHKLGNSAAIYMFHLLHNYELTFKSVYDTCKFLFVVGDARSSLNCLVGQKGYSAAAATRYYCYRLRRLAEMAKRTPGAVVMTWDHMASGRVNPLIEDYLGLKQPLPVLTEEYLLRKRKWREDLVSAPLLGEAEECQQRYLGFIFGQRVRYWR